MKWLRLRGWKSGYSLLSFEDRETQDQSAKVYFLAETFSCLADGPHSWQRENMGVSPFPNEHSNPVSGAVSLQPHPSLITSPRGLIS